jgi:uncharacterized metal-binding protein YceD (DUF177 family)
MNVSDTPFSANLDLGLVPERGQELELVPTEAQRAAISRWLGIEALESLKATVRISRKSNDEYAYSADFQSDVVQGCVVTLEPVRAHLSGEFERLYRVRPRSSPRRKNPPEEGRGIDLSVLDEEGPEWLETPFLDLAAPVLEELSLALDPYPRAPGVAFEPPAEEPGASENPFAVLERLKTAKSSPSGSPKQAPGPQTLATGKKRR